MADFSLSGGVEVTGFISPTDTTDTYPVIDTLYGIDGLRNVNNLTQLNAIPNERRRSGMLVGVSGGTEYYKLGSSPWSGTSVDWSIFTTSGGGTFTGNTSGDCIVDLYITNLYGCSPITVHDNIQSTTSSATGATSFAFGKNTKAFGTYSHAEGYYTTASGNYSHAEGGYGTIASGFASHAEGQQTIASGNWSHTEGFNTHATGTVSHTEGNLTQSIGLASHAEGLRTTASGNHSHAEGYWTTASGVTSHAEGHRTTASGDWSHAEGHLTIASGDYSHAEGKDTTASGDYSHAEGKDTTAIGNWSHAEGFSTTAIEKYSHSEGNSTTARGNASHAEGKNTTAFGYGSHAEGGNTTATSNWSHAEGSFTTTSGTYSHAEGVFTTASGKASHAEGNGSTSSGVYSHAEGGKTLASGLSSHAEGQHTIASGDFSHSGGYGGFFGLNTDKIIASGDTSFVHFKHTSGPDIIGAYGDYSAILGGSDHNIGTGSTSSGIFAGSGNIISNDVLRSVVLGGSNITGTTNDTVYVPNLDLCEFSGTLYTSSISGCSPITIGEANFPQGITVNDLPLLSQTQVKVSLTTAQLKDAYSVPIDAGIAAPGAGKAIIVTSLAVDYTVGVNEEGPDPFNFTRGNIRLQISGASSTGSGSQYATDDPGGGTGILNTTAFLPNMFIQGGNIGASTPSIFPNRILHITTDSDATSGTGSAIVYFTYYLLNI